MLECGHELLALRRVPQPVEELGPAPLRGIHAAAVVDGGQLSRVRHLGDERGLVLGPVIAPEIVVVERPEPRTNRYNGRSRGVQRDRCDVCTTHAGLSQRDAHRLNEGMHVRLVRLRGKIGIVGRTHHGVAGHAEAERTVAGVHDSHAHTLRAEINARYDGHVAAHPSRGTAWSPRARHRPRGQTCPPRDAQIRLHRCGATAAATPESAPRQRHQRS